MLSPFSILKDRTCISLREALDAVLSAEGLPTNDPAYHMIREHWKKKLKAAIQTAHLAGFDLKDRNPTSLTHWLTVPHEDRYQITGDLEAWYKAEKLKEESAGTSPSGRDWVGTVTNKPTTPTIELARSAIKPRKPRQRNRNPGAYLHEIVDTFEAAHRRTPTEEEVWRELAEKHPESPNQTITLYDKTTIDPTKLKDWYKQAFKKDKNT